VLASTGLELRALVTDIHLDGTMTGIELAEFAKQKFPQLNVVIVSGKEAPDLPGDILFLQKPYLPRDLLHAILN
jgi:FixJ family two-component response regulator